MSLSAWLYLINIVINVEVIMTIIFSIFLVFIFVIGVIKLATLDDPECSVSIVTTNVLRQLIKRWYFVLAFLFFFCLIPRESTMYLMLGSNYLSNSGIPPKVSQALNYKLDDILADLKGKTKDSPSAPDEVTSVSPSVLAHQYLKFARNDDD